MGRLYEPATAGDLVHYTTNQQDESPVSGSPRTWTSLSFLEKSIEAPVAISSVQQAIINKNHTEEPEETSERPSRHPPYKENEQHRPLLQAVVEPGRDTLAIANAPAA
jgi:hypothetical protein